MNDTRFIRFLILLLLASFGLRGALAEATCYPAPEGVEPSNRFQVEVNGKPCFTHETEVASFASFDFTGEVHVRIDPSHEVRWVDARPKSDAIEFEADTDTLSFTLRQPAQLSIELNGENTHPLYLFANPPAPEYPTGDGVIRFEGGKVHEAGEIRLQSNETLVIEGGAVVKGHVFAQEAENIRILGRGILDGSIYGTENRLERNRLLMLDRVRNSTVSGIIFLDSSTWTIEPMFCSGVTIANIKMVNWRYGSDGIDLVGCQEVVVRDSFIRANDDCIVLKTWGGTEKYPKTPIKGPDVYGIEVENCVLWNMAWGNAIEIGFELRADTVRDVTFRDCDIIAVERGAAISIHNGDYATVRDILYEDIRVENARHKLIDLAIFHSQYSIDRLPDEAARAENYLQGAWDGVQRVTPEAKASLTENRGHIRGITLRNLAVVDGPFPFSLMVGWDDEHAVEDVTIENMSVYGEPVTNAEQAKLHTEFVQSLEFR